MLFSACRWLSYHYLSSPIPHGPAVDRTTSIWLLLIIHRFDAAEKEEKFDDAVKKVKGKKEQEKSK
jgi:hypothetical protein